MSWEKTSAVSFTHYSAYLFTTDPPTEELCFVQRRLIRRMQVSEYEYHANTQISLIVPL
jgi:c-di-GMP-binding flagellar brake protein YcgR